MLFSMEWEEEIYSQSKQINRYPYGEFISIFFNSLKFLSNKSKKKDIKILELGCGTGNNIKFISELGYDVYGVDGSKSACRIANDFIRENNLEATIIESKFQILPFKDESFDMLVDREAMYCGTLDSIKESWKEANRVLKQGGVVISFMYTVDNIWCKKANKDNSIATKIENNTFIDFKEGNFKNTGIVHFCEYDELFQIFNFLDIKLINKHSNNSIFSDGSMSFSYDEWIVIGVKI